MIYGKDNLRLSTWLRSWLMYGDNLCDYWNFPAYRTSFISILPSRLFNIYLAHLNMTRIRSCSENFLCKQFYKAELRPEAANERKKKKGGGGRKVKTVLRACLQRLIQRPPAGGERTNMDQKDWGNMGQWMFWFAPAQDDTRRGASRRFLLRQLVPVSQLVVLVSSYERPFTSPNLLLAFIHAART